MMEKIIVASTNPVKINSAKIGFKEVFDKEFKIEGVKSESGVSDQPMTEEETFKGALNRISNIKNSYPEADYWVGIEGGIEIENEDLKVFACIIIESKSGLIGKSRTADFILPSKVAELVKQGKELGEADDIVFGRSNSKQEDGSVGILTHGKINRTSYYTHAVLLALIPFNNPELYS